MERPMFGPKTYDQALADAKSRNIGVGHVDHPEHWKHYNPDGSRIDVRDRPAAVAVQLPEPVFPEPRLVAVESIAVESGVL